MYKRQLHSNNTFPVVVTPHAPSSTPTASIAVLGLSGIDIDQSTNEVDAEEVVGSVAISSKKGSIEEDQLLINSWINCGIDQTIGTDKKGSTFWWKIAACFNEHRPQGSPMRSTKTCISR